MAESTLDFNSQSGIAEVLRRVRESGAAESEKSHIRDQIFTYIRSGGDKALKQELIEQINALPAPAKPEASQAKSEVQEKSAQATVKNDDTTAPTQPASPFGRSRAVPVFQTQESTAASTTAKSEPAPTTPNETATPSEEEVSPFTPEAAAEHAAPDAPAISSTAAKESEASFMEAEVESTPANTKSESEPAQSAPGATATETSTSEAAAAPTQSAPTSASPETTLDRIRAIKAEVNQKVGNPVHLMDDGNPVGREYMQTLLEAMKIAGGAAGNIDEVMGRLEELRKTVLEAGTQSSESAVQAPEAASPASVPAETTPEATTSAEANPSAPKPAAASAAPEPTQPADGQQTESAPAPTPTSVPATKPASTTEALEEQVSTPNPAVAAATPSAPPVPKQTAPAPADPSEVQQSTEPSQPQQPAPQSQNGAHLASLASVLNDDNPAAATTSAQPDPSTNEPAPAAPAQPVEPASDTSAPQSSSEPATPSFKPESNDPLFAQEITNGLDQLLSEWDLFKSSGIFGTGPSGREHPLYQRISGLPMVSVVSGRFEGATKEVRQSITDYMNGWRFEQGITHENTETFEHYLRRVIHHILHHD